MQAMVYGVPGRSPFSRNCSCTMHVQERELVADFVRKLEQYTADRTAALAAAAAAESHSKVNTLHCQASGGDCHSSRK